VIVSAGDRPEDDDIPDDIHLIGAGADEKYSELQGQVLDEFRAGTNRARDEQAMLEEAKRAVTMEFVELFENIRAGNVELNDLDRGEAEERADQVIRELAAGATDSSEGSDDE
jgi:hypothetical protein